jgi:hypothetical protein
MAPDRARTLTRRAREQNALAALRRGLRLFDSGCRDGMLAQTTEAFRTSRLPRVLFGLARVAGGARVASHQEHGSTGSGRPDSGRGMSSTIDRRNGYCSNTVPRQALLQAQR